MKKTSIKIQTNPHKPQVKFTLILILVLYTNILCANDINSTPHLFNLGTLASQNEISGWDIDVRPDGHGVPDGGASASDGEDLYDEKCASCHGAFGEGEGSWPKLIGEHESILTGNKPEKTVGSYWASASTLLDYIHRSMPFTQPQSLTWEETWAISAYVLYLNDIVDEDFYFDRTSFATIIMPNSGNFIADQRPDVKAPRCMKNCKNKSEIRITEALLGYASGAEDAEDFNTNLSRSTTHKGKNTYKTACGICHDLGVAGAPKIDNKPLWSQRLNQGIAQLYVHAIQGFEGASGIMPAKGGQTQLSDQQVKDAVDYILSKTGLNINQKSDKDNESNENN